MLYPARLTGNRTDGDRCISSVTDWRLNKRRVAFVDLTEYEALRQARG